MKPSHNNRPRTKKKTSQKKRNQPRPKSQPQNQKTSYVMKKLSIKMSMGISFPKTNYPPSWLRTGKMSNSEQCMRLRRKLCDQARNPPLVPEKYRITKILRKFPFIQTNRIQKLEKVRRKRLIVPRKLRR